MTQFEAPVTGLYTTEALETGTTDTHGFLCDSSAELLTSNNNSWNGTFNRNFRLFWVLNAGETYYITVTLANGASAGPYTLKVIPPTDKELQYGALGWAWPTTILKLSSYYGYRTYNGGEYHQGLDVATPEGTPVYAVADGTVIRTGFTNGMGNYIILKTDGIEEGKEATVRYMHLQSFESKFPSSGNNLQISVQKGEPIALSGETGNVSGPHLHFDVNFEGIAEVLPFADSTNPHLFYVNLVLEGKCAPDEPPI